MGINNREVVGILESQTGIVEAVAAANGRERRIRIERQDVALVPEAERKLGDLKAVVVRSVVEAPRVASPKRVGDGALIGLVSRPLEDGLSLNGAGKLGMEERREEAGRGLRMAAGRRRRRCAFEAEVAGGAGLVGFDDPRDFANAAGGAESGDGHSGFWATAMAHGCDDEEEHLD